MNNKEIKQEARYLLKGKWLKLAFIYLIFSVFVYYVDRAPTILQSSSTAFTLGMAILGLILTILVIPFAYGIISVMVKAVRGEEVRIFEFVSTGLKNFKGAYFLVFSVIINLAIQIVAFVAAAFLLNYGYEHSSSFLIVTGGIIYLITVFFLFAKLFYYLLGMFVMIDNEEAGAKKNLDESKEIMSLERMNLLKLIVSFIGWFILLLVIVSAIAILKAPYTDPNVAAENLQNGQDGIIALITLVGFALLFPYFQISMYVFYEYHKDPHYKYNYEEHMKEKTQNRKIAQPVKEKNKKSKKDK